MPRAMQPNHLEEDTRGWKCRATFGAKVRDEVAGLEAALQGSDGVFVN